MKLFIKYWLPVVFWMGVIFLASADTQSGIHSGSLIGPLLAWLKLSPEARETAHVIFRKFGHLTEYAILAMFIYRARLHIAAKALDYRATALFALALATVYAAADEYHQSFVPHREAQLTDVLIDGLGACLGLGLIWLSGRIRRR
jgi:VanZ family protein